MVEKTMNFIWTKGDYDKILNELEAIVRRQNQQQKTLDLLFEDRNILEQLQGGLTDIKTQLELTRQHDSQTKKDIKEEVNATAETVMATVEGTVGGLRDSLLKKTVLKVKTPSLLQNIREWWQKAFKRN